MHVLYVHRSMQPEHKSQTKGYNTQTYNSDM